MVGAELAMHRSVRPLVNARTKLVCMQWLTYGRKTVQARQPRLYCTGDKGRPQAPTARYVAAACSSSRGQTCVRDGVVVRRSSLTTVKRAASTPTVDSPRLSLPVRRGPRARTHLHCTSFHGTAQLNLMPKSPRSISSSSSSRIVLVSSYHVSWSTTTSTKTRNSLAIGICLIHGHGSHTVQTSKQFILTLWMPYPKGKILLVFLVVIKHYH